ncbi:hypothetical protein MIZ03_0998 [Rhodoferax lithotrophicus]|uniref:Uncharacterized protein n=1 Tax=Rhodoferax lithotrophicus TaxID=2798804 RepID=A0ABM7MIQ8_9BURK|nr:hypothetical protein MIZ03_0998 [Rhodoferax sp. MIZ03]
MFAPYQPFQLPNFTKILKLSYITTVFPNFITPFTHDS